MSTTHTHCNPHGLLISRQKAVLLFQKCLFDSRAAGCQFECGSTQPAAVSGPMEDVRRLGAMHREKQAELQRLRAELEAIDLGATDPHPHLPPAQWDTGSWTRLWQARSLLRRRGHVGRPEFQAESSRVGRSRTRTLGNPARQSANTWTHSSGTCWSC